MATRSSFAQHGMDKKLDSYFGLTRGFFIEVGANDGVKQSNTLYFEKYLGWSGLLIEPIPALAKKCRKNRPNCIVENAALVSFAYPEKSITLTYCGLMSVVAGYRVDEEKFLKSGRRFLKKGDVTHNISVSAKPLSDILDHYGLQKIDFLSLDVEGYEPEVLRGVDFKKHIICWILIEARDEKEIESIIGEWYELFAILSSHENYTNALYKRRN